MKKRVLLIAPLNAIGGINSWANNLQQNFVTEDYKIYYCDNFVLSSQVTNNSFVRRFWNYFRYKIFDFIKILLLLLSKLRGDSKVAIVHLTTSGSAGTIRDCLIGLLCRKYNVPLILHCHYGNIPAILHQKSVYGRLLIYTLKLCKQVWVLDSKSFLLLKNKFNINVFLVPNPILCQASGLLFPQTFNNVIFCANVLPEKGIYDLVESITLSKNQINLTIVGRADESVINRISELAEKKSGNWLKITGPLNNADALNIIKSSDILCLPTYYPAEAFPISILEAMSYGKLVIATDRAAIPDILGDYNGGVAGLLVPEHSPQKIAEALDWCLSNPVDAGQISRNAFNKVKALYSNEVVFDRYIKLYNQTLEENNYK